MNEPTTKKPVAGSEPNITDTLYNEPANTTLTQNNDSSERPPFIDVTRNKEGVVTDERVSPVGLEEWMRANVPFKILQSGNSSTIYVYDNGIYRMCSDNQFKGLIKAQIDVYNPRLVSTRLINEVFNLLIMETDNIEPDDFNADENLINFRNGILHLDTMELEPHNPDELFTIQIPCDWTGSDCPTPVFDKYMDDLTSSDSETKKLLMQIVGICISNVYGYRFKKGFFLLGHGDTGKSQLRRLMELLIGPNNCFSTDLSNLETQFGVSNIYQKRMVGSADMGFISMDELKIFKQLSGGDSVFADVKYKAGMSFVFKGVLFFATNSLPKFGGDSGQWVYDRFCIIKCDNVIPKEKQDKQLCDKMYSERDGIVYKAIMALKDVIANDYRLSESQKIVDVRADYQKENSAVLRFFDDCMVSSAGIPSDKIDTAAYIYKAFTKWCSANNNRHVISNTQFRDELAAYLNTDKSKLFTHSRNGTVISGYTLADDAKILYLY